MKLLSTVCLLVLSLGAVLSIPVSPAQLKLLQVARANDDFDQHLLQAIESEALGKNVFLSSFSVSTALAMLMAGGKERTYTEIFNTLGYTDTHFSDEDINIGFQKMLNELNHPEKSMGNTLSVANSVAIQKNRQVLESYMNSVTTYFGSQVFVEDFSSATATDELNSWVSEKTHSKIPKLFDSPLSPDTAMVLLNAIYFKGIWEYKFEEKSTKSADFHVTKDQVESVSQMALRAHLRYANFEDGQLLEIPYQNVTMSMFVFLPHENQQTRAISSALSVTNLDHRMQELNSNDVILHLPKFKIEGSYSLKPTLSKLGIQDAFTKAADFSNIDGHKDLFVSEVVHKTFIEVNEEGSEAAAATGIVVREFASIDPPPRPVEFNVNRPFMFFIRDNDHHVTLFSGVINKP